MKKLISALICVFLSIVAFAQVDSTAAKELDKRLNAYFKTLEYETIEAKNAECDKLIQAATDSSVRALIAQKVYKYYLDSPIMGDEAVSIHIADTWFFTDKIKMASDMDSIDALIFADFNRQSLLGERAPLLELKTPEGTTVEVGNGSSRYSVIFFYDTSCPKCNFETVMLRSLLNQKGYPIDFYAVYTGANAQSWEKWRDEKFKITNPDVNVVHLWDPEVSSDYQRKYGVLQTPRMFLIDHQGIIIGRGMNHEALQQMLDVLLASNEYEYGSDRSMQLIDNLFAPYADSLTAESVLETAQALEKKTLAKGDTLFFKHLEGDLLYWLVSRREEALRNGTKPFIEDYILSRGDIWNTPEDTLQVVGFANMLEDLLSRTPIGSKVPKMKIAGWNLLRRKGGILLFHTHGCPICENEITIANFLNLNYLAIDVDKLDDPVKKQLMDTFDLSALPYIIKVGKRGVVQRKYMTLLN